MAFYAGVLVSFSCCLCCSAATWSTPQAVGLVRGPVPVLTLFTAVPHRPVSGALLQPSSVCAAPVARLLHTLRGRAIRRCRRAGRRHAFHRAFCSAFHRAICRAFRGAVYGVFHGAFCRAFRRAFSGGFRLAFRQQYFRQPICRPLILYHACLCVSLHSKGVLKDPYLDAHLRQLHCAADVPTRAEVALKLDHLHVLDLFSG
mmetsp:Transcript_15844/g.38576  ORF Transcript_15844/g.38576 Transcript_15844/m.38576 type:complete len:202 (-) Transcript_15844:255-860(-)